MQRAANLAENCARTFQQISELEPNINFTDTEK